MEDSSKGQNDCWKTCHYCKESLFKSPEEFEKHIQQKHALKDGSWTLCRYGLNGLCPSLQFGDLSTDGFHHHVLIHHIRGNATTSSWTFYSSSQNLPAVLNDPNRGKQTSFFTKIWGDSFVEKTNVPSSPHLPEITLSHFEHYCKRIIKRYRRHCQLLNEKLPPSIKNKTAALSVCSSKTPEIFYKANLPLNKVEVFDKVFPTLTNSTDSATSARQLQEQLSQFLDEVEVKIARQVALKSDAFFHAMLSHDTVMEQMATGLRLVKNTRENISKSKAGLTLTPLNLIKSIRCRKNMNSVLEQLKAISTVQQTQPMIQLLLSTSDYVAALDLISSTQKALSTQLTGIHAFRHLSPQLTEMERLIDKMLNNEFQRLAVGDLNRSTNDNTELPEKDKMVSVLSGLLRLKELDFIDNYKSEAIATIQATVKQVTIEIVCQREGNTEIVLRGSHTDNASLEYGEGITFLEKVAPALIVVLKRISTLCNLILQVCQMDDIIYDELLTPEDCSKIEDKLKKIIKFLSDYCNERCANLILKNNNINGSQVMDLSQLIDKFTDDCEITTGTRSNALKLTLKSYAMKYVQQFHIERKNKLTLLLDNERWKSADVPSELQSLVSRIASTGKIPETLQCENISSSKSTTYLLIGNEPYAVVGTVLILIRIICEYCQCASRLPSVSQYIDHCLLELFRFFNSRCCQLVLGAGALQSAGLKTITTGNLALVIRALQVLLWLMPIVQNHIESIEKRESAANGFRALEKDIQSHKAEIENKIYAIVSNLLGNQLVDWDAKPPVPSQTFRNISKHLVKLHEALTNVLPISQIRTIYKTVHLNFKDKLRDKLRVMNIVANGGPQHGVVTSELTFYLQTLRTLQVISEEDLDDNLLYEIWI